MSRTTARPDDTEPEEGSTPAPQPARWTALARKLGEERYVARLIELGAIIPVIATLIEVFRAPRLQFLDYWWVFNQVFWADGSVRVEGLGRLQNEHFLGLPTILYWLDALLFSGDQRMLGVVAVLMAAGAVLVIRASLPASLPAMVRASMVFATSFILFTLHGLHYFSRGMSGVAWLGANLLVISALALAFRRRWVPAIACGLLASVTYGTAFALWPVLFLVAVWNREPLRTRIAPLVAGAVIAGGWLFMSRGGDLAAGTAPADDLGSLIFRYLTLFGHVWTAENTGLAAVIGTLMLAGYGVLLTTKTAREPRLRFWWAFALHAMLSCGLVALARIDFGSDAGLFGRYTSVSVMAVIPLLVLTVAVVYPPLRRHHHKIAIAVVASGLLAFSLGATAAATVRDENRMHALQAIGMRLGLSNGYTTLNWPLPPSGDLTPRMKALDHYPYNDDFTLGCPRGVELGSRLDPKTFVPLTTGSELEALPLDPAGALLRADSRSGAELFYGWVSAGRDQLECVVLVGSDGRVVGGGVTHLRAKHISAANHQVVGNRAFAVIGRDGVGEYIVAVTDKGTMLSLPTRGDSAPTYQEDGK